MKSLKNIIKEKLVINKSDIKQQAKVDWTSAKKVFTIVFHIPDERDRWTYAFEIYPNTRITPKDNNTYEIYGHPGIMWEYPISGWKPTIVKNLPNVAETERNIFRDREVHFFIPITKETEDTISYLINYLSDNIKTYTIKEIFEIMGMKIDEEYFKKELYLNPNRKYDTNWEKSWFDKLLTGLN